MTGLSSLVSPALDSGIPLSRITPETILACVQQRLRERLQGFVLAPVGKPGSGKGTSASCVAEELGLDSETCSWVLEESALPEHQAEIAVRKATGQMVPDHIVISCMAAYLDRYDGIPYLLDGYPRTKDQAKAFFAYLRQRRYRLVLVDLDLDDETCYDRMVKRVVCVECRKSFSTDDFPEDPTTCPSCGDSLICRIDGSPTNARERLRVYQEQTKPAVEYCRNIAQYGDGECIYIKVDASQPSEEVIQAVLNNIYQLAGITY